MEIPGGWGMGGTQMTLWKGNSKGVGVKTEEPSVGGMDIFWNNTKINLKRRNQRIYSPCDENITAVRKKDKSSKLPQKQAHYFEINHISTVLN